jgi:hypothetical protein
MLASNVDDMTSHETSKFLIFNLKTIANKLKYDYSLYTLRVNIRILTCRSLASNWSSVDEDLWAQVKARRVSRRTQAWWARARVIWTRLYNTTGCMKWKSKNTHYGSLSDGPSDKRTDLLREAVVFSEHHMQIDLSLRTLKWEFLWTCIGLHGNILHNNCCVISRSWDKENLTIHKPTYRILFITL